MPLTKPGRVGAAVLLRQADGLVERDLGRDVVAVVDLVERDAHDAALERRDPVDRPAARVSGDLRVELGRVARRDALGELAGERLRALSSSSSGRPGRPRAGRGRRPRRGAGRSGASRLSRRPRYARDVLARARVDAHPLALVDEQRHVDRHAGLERRRASSPPPDAVSPFTPGSVLVTVMSTALATWTSGRPLVDEEHLDLVVRAHPLHRVAGELARELESARSRGCP